MKSWATTDFKRPAVFVMNWIGDQLLGLPAMRALSAIFPDGLQLLLGEGMLSFLYRGLPVSEPVRIRWNDFENGRVDRIVRASDPCDLFLSLSTLKSPFVTTLARSMGARRTVGFEDIFDDMVHVVGGAHAFDRAFAVPLYLKPSLRFDQFCAPPSFSPSAEAAAARYVSANCGSQRRLLFVHPETQPEKRWTREGFAWVIERFLAERHDYTVLVSSLSSDDLCVHNRRVRRIDAHLELTLAVMRHVDLFLGIDSCFLHAADLFRIPGVALFGPTKPAEWGFRLSPCFHHVAAQSMDKIRTEPVLDAILELADVVETADR